MKRKDGKKMSFREKLEYYVGWLEWYWSNFVDWFFEHFIVAIVCTLIATWILILYHLMAGDMVIP